MKNWCTEHETVWFKKGNMKGYAHPIKEGDETVGWCNRPKDWEEEDEPEKEAVKQGGVVESVKPKYKADPDKTASIELQVCLKAATDLSVALINAGILKEKITERTISTFNEFKKLF